jgi:hypothetical protein
MGYAAIALAIMGLLTGMMSRLRVLLTIVALLLPVSVAFALSAGFGFLNTALTVLIAQTILQTSYFLGLVAAAFSHRLAAGSKSAEVTAPSDQAPAARREAAHGF